MADKQSSDSGSVAKAATTVNSALEPLEPEDRERVLAAAAALYGVRFGGAAGRRDTRVIGAEQSDNELRAPPLREKKRSLVEVVRTANPATNPQRLAVFAHYREYEEGQPNFARSDLLPYFAMAKEPKPGNYDRDFASAVREGWIHEDGAKSYLTETGRKAVEAGFAGKAKPRGLAAKKPN
jgi:hypothetical protein